MILLLLLLFVGTAQAEGWPDAPAVKCITNDRGECLQGHFMAPIQDNSWQNRQAGEWIVDKGGQRLTKILADKDGNTILLECQDGAPCEYTASARHLFACHQKMQEAMKEADKVLRFPRVYVDKTVGPVVEYQASAPMSPHWGTTMKECVGRDR